jgi:alcohol dehydrogenase (cytochrome c)
MALRPLLATVSAAAFAIGTLAAAGEVATYAPVTAERLANPEPGNWLSIRRTYDGQSHSPLDQINASNVKDLKVVWNSTTGPRQKLTDFAALPADPANQAPPLVNGDVMIYSAGDNQVIAYETKTGAEIWRYVYSLPEGLVPVHPTNRGVALWGDKVYLATLDAHLVALDAKTGTKVWDKTLANWEEGYYSTLAPLIVDGTVMSGVSGGEFGIRGFVEAFDAETGESVWKTYTIPSPDEPSGDTWPGDTWQRGGGPIWITGNYDQTNKLTYWGTGNAAPWVGALRPGDNLHTASVLGVDPKTGKIVTHFQYHHNDTWDWDETVAPVLVDLDGKQLAVKFARNGYVYKLDREDGQISFVEGKPYVFQNVFTGLDPKTGRPSYDSERLGQLGKRVEFCPSAWGGRDWVGESIDPSMGYAFISVNENHCGAMEAAEVEYEPGVLYLGSGLEMTPTEAAKDHIGAIQAWDLRTMEKVWQTNFKSPNWGPILSTSGGLIFAGGTNDAEFRAFDAKTGEVVWSQRLDGGVVAQPIAFERDGKEYIAVATGWGVDAGRFQGYIDQAWGTKTEVPLGGSIWVFALP